MNLLLDAIVNVNDAFELVDRSLLSLITQPGVLVCSIDNMPAQMPTEATSYFGSLLLPHIDDLVSH